MTNGVKAALIIGGGLAGIEAALKIGQGGYPAVLVEKEAELGGNLRQLYSSFPRWENPGEILAQKLQQLAKNSEVEVLTSTTVVSSQRSKNSFVVKLQQGGTEREVEAASVILATGFDLFDASCYGEYGYGIYNNVFNSLEFESKLKEWGNGKVTSPKPGGVAFIACVGSRDRSKGYPYCSKICCMYLAKQAGLVKDFFPEANCYVFYMDYRATGKEYEEFVRSVIEDKHVRYVRGRPAKVLAENGRLLLRAEDTLIGVPIEVTVDMVVLATAMVPHQETVRLASMFGASTDNYGFLQGDALNPLRAGERVFFAGTCGFATEMAGAQHQGAAVAAEVIALLNTSNLPGEGGS